MSTRCIIAIKENDGTYRSIYCHHDGYPSGVGDTLETYYTNRNKIEALMDLGDISSLGASLDFKDPDEMFKNPKAYALNNGTTDYNRWRNEGTKAEISKNLNDLKELAFYSSAEYLYTFENEKWKVRRI